MILDLLKRKIVIVMPTIAAISVVIKIVVIIAMIKIKIQNKNMEKSGKKGTSGNNSNSGVLLNDENKHEIEGKSYFCIAENMLNKIRFMEYYSKRE